MRRLAAEPVTVMTAERSKLDLRRQADVEAFLSARRPQIVIVAAAKVGGILANQSEPAAFLHDNLAIASNVIGAAAMTGVRKLLFLGSSCIYPRMAEQPIREEALLTGALEPTNEWYALAKIAGIKLCQAYRQQFGYDFIAAQPTNLYGPGDNFDPQTSHVLPALLHKMHSAKVARAPAVSVWGSGKPMREFLHVDDLADALVFLLERYSDPMPINVGSGQEISIEELADAIRSTVGYSGRLEFDPLRPDGTPRKLLDSSRLHELGWNRARPLSQGIAETYRWYLANPDRLRGPAHASKAG
jgi:GDP-L-fucose synthase